MLSASLLEVLAGDLGGLGRPEEDRDFISILDHALSGYLGEFLTPTVAVGAAGWPGRRRRRGHTSLVWTVNPHTRTDNGQSLHVRLNQLATRHRHANVRAWQVRCCGGIVLAIAPELQFGGLL